MPSSPKPLPHVRHQPPARPSLEPRYDPRLPIYSRKDEIVAALQRHQVIVIAGETGSGKTTQLPLMCLEAGRGVSGSIACTQPRRIAATSIARYVAERMQVPLGSQVGYRIRFDQKVSADTRVTFMTDGVLLTDLQHDRRLRRYDTIIIDEAHERSLNIDVLLGYLRRLLPSRPDLRLIISSATIDTQLFSHAFGDAPVLEVSGRLYPVDIVYRPAEMDEDGVTQHYIEAATDAVEELVGVSDRGDLLVFMPTQQDITETIEKLEGRRLAGHPQLLPLYGRLPAAEQNRIFAEGGGRKIVVATNVAETSITVPGIRFVVDTGLARTVRYVPHQHTSRMPVEPVSKASANQRSGRCGRVQDGICVRLYSEEDFAVRPEFTTPEIKRTNLAGVVLQMESMSLGPVEEFPFVEPPERRTVVDGYAVLTDLGALTPERTLTPLGREMARLPADPHISRMILQARGEQALREVTIIAAGLSIVDPRERPQDKQELADAAHKRFLDPMSDFLTYLKVWDTYQSEWETLRTQNRMRRFCRDHFLSFNRMREWHDVHNQLRDICSRMSGFGDNRKAATYDAIHRSLLAALVHNVAMLGEKGEYRATRGRSVHIFPGSSLFRKSHPWIMCQEVVETSRVYARTAAVIKPEWIEDLAPGLCRSSYAEPTFDEETGSVRAVEQVTFLGLQIVKARQVFYGSINPQRASQVFVEEGLVRERLRTHHRFVRHNADIRAQVETLEAKLRTRSLYAGDEVIAQFYQERLPNVATEHDLNRVIRQHGSDSFLRLRIEDLLTTGSVPAVADLPDALDIGGKRFAVAYRFSPGSPDDGICITVPQVDFSRVHENAFEWALSGLWPARVRALLEQLPKQTRKELVPLNESAARIAAKLSYSPERFASEVRRVVKQEFGLRIPEESFAGYVPDAHLWPQVTIVDPSGKELLSWRTPGRPPAPAEAPAAVAELSQAFGAWCRTGVTTWSFGDLPERVEERARGSGMPLYGHPALQDAGDQVNLTVCASPRQAEHAHRGGVVRLAETVLASELAWEEREARLTPAAALLAAPLVEKKRVEALLGALIRAHGLALGEDLPRSATSFQKYLQRCRVRLSGTGRRVSATMESALRAYAACAALMKKRSASVKSEPARFALGELRRGLKHYVERMFEPFFSLEMLEQYPRYFQAYLRRIDGGCEEPLKYRERITGLSTWDAVARQALQKAKPDNPAACRRAMEFEMMAEEYAISLFAQQAVKTRYPVSEKRLKEKLDEMA